MYLYDESTGLVRRQKFGVGDDGLKLPVLRRNVLPPCRAAEGCSKGTPERQLSLNAKNRRAYRHFMECKAIGKWPEDGIVRQNAGIIEAAISGAEIALAWMTTKHQRRLEEKLETVLRIRAM